MGEPAAHDIGCYDNLDSFLYLGVFCQTEQPEKYIHFSI